MSPLSVLIIVVTVALPIIFLVYNSKMEKKRKADLRQAAELLKLTYQEGDQPDLLSSMEKFKTFSRGERSRKISNLMSGKTEDLALKIFDYRYRIGSGKNSTTHFHTIVHVRSSLMNLPAFSLTPESVFHRIGDFFGMKDIDFDMYPEFSQQYLLKGPEEEAIRKLFNREKLTFFTDNPQFSVEGQNDEMIIFKSRGRVKVPELQQFFKESLRISHLFMG